MIKDIVFDFGGVLTTIDTDEALRRFAALGIEEPGSMINSYCQKGPFFKLENGDINADEFCQRLGAMCGREITFAQAQHAWLGFLVEIHTDLLNYLQTLRGKYRLSVLSNTNPFIQSWARTPAFTPQSKSLDDYFDTLFLSYEMKCSKPSREIFQKMLQSGNMDAATTLFVDDSEKNIEAAASMGIQTLLVKNGEDWRSALELKLATQ